MSTENTMADTFERVSDLLFMWFLVFGGPAILFAGLFFIASSHTEPKGYDRSSYRQESSENIEGFVTVSLDYKVDHQRGPAEE